MALGLVYLMTQVYLDPGVKVKVKVTLWDQTIIFTLCATIYGE